MHQNININYPRVYRLGKTTDLGSYTLLLGRFIPTDRYTRNLCALLLNRKVERKGGSSRLNQLNIFRLTLAARVGQWRGTRKIPGALFYRCGDFQYAAFCWNCWVSGSQLSIFGWPALTLVSDWLPQDALFFS